MRAEEGPLTVGPALEANVDGLVGPTHSYVGLSPGNLASERHRGEVSDPRAAALQGLAKMTRVAALGLPQFVLPPHERPDLSLLRGLGFGGDDARVLDQAWAETPAFAAAACSASAMWAANAATVTPSADAADGRLHLTPANLISNLHRSLEPPQTQRALQALFPDSARFAVHDPLPAQAHLADEGAANHVRLCGGPGGQGVNLFVWGREAYASWAGRFPARHTREASVAIARRHGVARAVFPRQGARAIEGGAFHNDVVCVGAGGLLLFHEAAFEDVAGMRREVAAAARDLFEPRFVCVSERELPLATAVATYLFNSQLIAPPGEARPVLLAPVEVEENAQASAVAERWLADGQVGSVDYVDVRQSMRNGGGPACLRLRLTLTDEELAATNARQRLTPELADRLERWIRRWYRDRLSPDDLRDPALIDEGRGALDALTSLLGLGGGFYPFQRASPA